MDGDEGISVYQRVQSLQSWSGKPATADGIAYRRAGEATIERCLPCFDLHDAYRDPGNANIEQRIISIDLRNTSRLPRYAIRVAKMVYRNKDTGVQLLIVRLPRYPVSDRWIIAGEPLSDVGVPSST